MIALNNLRIIEEMKDKLNSYANSNYDHSGKNILNLGCGEDMYGTHRVDVIETPATTHVQDIEKCLPFAEREMFDEVYCKSIWEHVLQLKTVINEIRRVLKKDGKLFIRTDNASYIGFLFKNHQDYIKYDYSPDDKHYHLFKEEHLRNMFEKDFIIDEIRFTCPSKKLFFLPRRFKCMHIEMIARKR